MTETKIKVGFRKKAYIETFPLIDVVFFLLATFVLFIFSLNKIQSVLVDFPVPNLNANQTASPDIVALQVSA